ncbi:MAG: hypothetical protein Q4P65_02170 [Eubacteriales bacterium]|nr:hypothetical protein [Eubacteriales bacterium]
MPKQFSRQLIFFLCLTALLILVNVAELFYSLASEDYSQLGADATEVFEAVRTYLLIDFWFRTIGLIGLSVYAFYYWPKRQFSRVAKLVFVLILIYTMGINIYQSSKPLLFRILNIVLTAGLLYYQAFALEEK